LIIGANILTQEKLELIYNECGELLAIFSTIAKGTKL
jgi:hypothetical protein